MDVFKVWLVLLFFAIFEYCKWGLKRSIEKIASKPYEVRIWSWAQPDSHRDRHHVDVVVVSRELRRQRLVATAVALHHGREGRHRDRGITRTSQWDERESEEVVTPRNRSVTIWDKISQTSSAKKMLKHTKCFLRYNFYLKLNSKKFVLGPDNDSPRTRAFELNSYLHGCNIWTKKKLILLLDWTEVIIKK